MSLPPPERWLSAGPRPRPDPASRRDKQDSPTDLTPLLQRIAVESQPARRCPPMELAQVATQASGATLLGAALALGMRHGIDWDHIAAITDITSTTTNVETADERGAGGLSSGIAAAPRLLSFGAVELRA